MKIHAIFDRSGKCGERGLDCFTPAAHVSIPVFQMFQASDPKPDCSRCLTKGRCLFQSLPPAVLPHVVERIHKPGDRLEEQGALCGTLGVIKVGQVKG